MFEKMRRDEKELSLEKTYEALDCGEVGILSVIDQDGWPYGVPLNFGRRGDTLYFHGAKEGKKASLFQEGAKGAFTVVTDYTIHPKDFDTHYISVMAFGILTEIKDKEEKRESLLSLIEKYSPDYRKEGEQYIARAGDGTNVYALKIEELTGKVGS